MSRRGSKGSRLFFTTAMAEPEVKIQNEQSSDVAVKADPPVLAKIEIKPEASKLVSVADGLTKAPTTTTEEDLHSKSQRKVNLIWEFTQAGIAMMVTAATIVTAVILAFRSQGETALQLLSNAFFLVIGFYFSRSNHTNVGGVKLPYQGR